MMRFGMAVPKTFVALGIAVLALTLALVAAGASAQEKRAIPPKDRENPLNELISGYYFSDLETRALQDDDFDNPGFRWVQTGETLWTKTDGTAQKSCASCHGSASDAMRGKTASYPKFVGSEGRVLNLEQRINLCRESKMRASPWAYETEELLGMTTYLRLQSRGAPVNVAIDQQARAAFDQGRTLYQSRMGQLGMSCALCHNQHYGRSYRADVVSQGHSNGFPVFERSTGTFTSLHNRFSACFGLMKAEPFAPGSDEYVALELYLGWRGNGLPVETPAVRR
jgi:L-cysteine S-thiosulfotransferase